MLLAACGLGLFSQALSIVIPLCVGKFYQLTFSGGSARGHLFDQVFGHIQNIDSFFLLFVLVIASKFVFQWASKWYTARNGEYFIKYLKDILFEHQLKTQLTYFKQRSVGKYLLRYSGDLQSVQRMVTHGYIGAFNDTLFMIGSIALLWQFNVWLTCIIMASIPLVFTASYFLEKAQKNIVEKKRDSSARNLDFVSERLHAIMTIKAMNRFTPEVNQFQKLTNKQLNINLQYRKYAGLQSALITLLSYLLLMAVMYGAYNLQQQGGAGTDGATLLVFIMLTIQIIPTIRRWIQAGMYRQNGMLSMQKIGQLMQLPVEDLRKETIAVHHGQLSIEHLQVSYQGKQIIHDWSASCPPKAITWIRGQQGSGKTLLSGIMLGLITPDAGEISLDEHHYTDVSLFALRKHITLVSNDMPLLGKTIYDALVYSAKRERKEEIVAMLTQLGFSDAASLPDQKLGAKGRHVSAGEMQLLRVARALLTDKKVIIMDSPFVDLDATSIQRVCALLNTMKNKHTIILLSANIPDAIKPDAVYSLS